MAGTADLQAAFVLKGTLPAPFVDNAVTVERESLEERSSTPVAKGTLAGGSLDLQVDAGPGLYTLKLGEAQVSFVAGSDQTLTVTVSPGKKKPQVGGAADQDAYLAYEEFRSTSLARHVLVVREAIRTAASAGNDTEVDRLTEAEVTGYQTHRRELNDFTLDHLRGTAALYAASLRWDGDYRLDDLKAAVTAYATDNTSADIVGLMQERIARFEAVAIGAIAPELSGPAPEGGKVSLASLRGKFVLVDFWASWCAPCRNENRNYAELYRSYRDKGFEILAVSVDQSGPAWRGAIAKDGAAWLHLSDLSGWKSPLAARYNVAALPASFLLDPQGRIIAKDARGSALAAVLEQHLRRPLAQSAATRTAP